MPNCFSLTRLSSPGNGPVPLVQIDEEMCKHFNVKPDPVKYYAYWYDYVGFPLAMGKTFADIREQFKKDAKEQGPQEAAYWERLIAIVDWLDANFTVDAWVQIGK